MVLEKVEIGVVVVAAKVALAKAGSVTGHRGFALCFFGRTGQARDLAQNTNRMAKIPKRFPESTTTEGERNGLWSRALR